MKKVIFLLCLFCLAKTLTAQDKPFDLYKPGSDANGQVMEAISQAESSQKHIMLQIGGNWCKWCRMFYQFSTTNAQIDSVLKADYIVVHINFSKEDKNTELLKKLDFPQRFGFPVFVILDSKGNRIHTQNTSYLEDGEGYSEKKVVEFLKQWNKESISEKL